MTPMSDPQRRRIVAALLARAAAFRHEISRSWFQGFECKVIHRDEGPQGGFYFGCVYPVPSSKRAHTADEVQAMKRHHSTCILFARAVRSSLLPEGYGELLRIDDLTYLDDGRAIFRHPFRNAR